ncbi:MAG: ATP synthase subunit I [Oscillospiraceae bacterium]|nr:ATP synthase subunit I [Oscillospiraceae bacterium]
MERRNKAVEALRSMLPILLIAVALTGVMIGVYALLGKLTGKVLLGALLGTAAALLNFAVMTFSVVKAESAESPERGALQVRLNYVIRMLVLAAALIVALKTDLFDPVATVLPLCFTRIAIFISEIFRKKEAN